MSNCKSRDHDEFLKPDRCQVAECEESDRNDGSQPQREGWTGFAVEDAEQGASDGEQEPDDKDRNRQVPDADGRSGGECVCHDDALLSCQVVAYATISRKKTPLRQRSALSPPSFLAALSSKAIPSSPSSSLA